MSGFIGIAVQQGRGYNPTEIGPKYCFENAGRRLLLVSGFRLSEGTGNENRNPELAIGRCQTWALATNRPFGR